MENDEEKSRAKKEDRKNDYFNKNKQTRNTLNAGKISTRQQPE